MSIMSDYYDTTGEWKHITGTDDYNQATYGVSSVPCKIIDKIKLIRDKHGTQVVSMTTVFTDAKVKVDDLFNKRIVISVCSKNSLDGLEGYEVNLA